MADSQKTLLAGYLAVTVVFFIGLFAYAKYGPAIPLSVSSVTTTKTSLFSVSAEGKALAKPDTALVNLGFTSNGSGVSQVQDEANSTINKVVSAVKNLGIGESDIQTTNYNLRPDYDYQASPQRIRGYVIDVNIQVKVRDFSKLNQVIDAATANGANQVGGLSFIVDNPDKYLSEARKQAIDKAKQKAADIASETGITLGRVVDVTESDNSSPRPIPMMAADAKGIGGGAPVTTEIQPGSSEITLTVTLSYETR